MDELKEFSVENSSYLDWLAPRAGRRWSSFPRSALCWWWKFPIPSHSSTSWGFLWKTRWDGEKLAEQMQDKVRRQSWIMPPKIWFQIPTQLSSKSFSGAAYAIVTLDPKLPPLATLSTAVVIVLGVERWKCLQRCWINFHKNKSARWSRVVGKWKIEPWLFLRFKKPRKAQAADMENDTFWLSLTWCIISCNIWTASKVISGERSVSYVTAIGRSLKTDILLVASFVFGARLSSLKIFINTHRRSLEEMRPGCPRSKYQNRKTDNCGFGPANARRNCYRPRWKTSGKSQKVFLFMKIAEWLKGESRYFIALKIVFEWNFSQVGGARHRYRIKPFGWLFVTKLDGWWINC